MASLRRYEVYDKRALYEDPRTLPLLDRTDKRARAVASANAWGGLVLERRLQDGAVVATEVVYVHQARRPDELEEVTLRDLFYRLFRGMQRPKTKPRPPV